MKLPREIEALIGSEEATIFKVVAKGYSDVTSIHLLTGIPIGCVERKLAALAEIELLVKVDDGYAINDQSMLLGDRGAAMT
jgi:hypothetical protein